MVIIKSREEMTRVKEACRVVGETLNFLRGLVRDGVTTGELESKAEEFMRKQDGIPAFKGYKGYPASICTSVNDEVVHGIPSGRRLMEGDIISIDLGVYKGGFYGDAAVTLPVGKISDEAMDLLKVTEEALDIGVRKAREGGRVSDIGNAVQRHVEQNGFSIVRTFVGHGIGKALHEEPQIPNYGRPGRGLRIRGGMALAIEPMVNAGGYEVVVLEDGWTAVTTDGSLSAHFEHTVAVTANGPQVLTKTD